MIEILGIMTQCALLWKIADNHSLRSYCENLLRKINHKNSGINTKVNLDIALKNKKSRTDSYMFFGADVIHPTNVTRQHPSIAGRFSFRKYEEKKGWILRSSCGGIGRFAMFYNSCTCLSTVSKRREMFD